MMKIERTPHLLRISDEKLIDYFSDEAGPRLCAEVEEWRAQSPGNEKHLRDIHNLLYMATRVNEFNKKTDIDRSFAELKQRLAERRKKVGVFRTIPRKNFKRFLVAASSAAAVLVVVTVMYLFPFSGQLQSSENIVAGNTAAPDEKITLTLPSGKVVILSDPLTDGIAAEEALQYEAEAQAERPGFYNLRTPPGETYRLSLPDGTLVWLNGGSSIKYPASMNGDIRRVEIAGEVHLDVASSMTSAGVKRSFIAVIPGRMEIDVLGTQFNVKAYPDESSIITTLVEGEINLLSYASGSSVTIQAGQQISMNGQGQLKVVAADTEEANAWMSGKFVFRNADIRNMMRQIARWYDVDVRYRGEVTHHFVGTISRRLSLPEVLGLLEGTGDVQFHIEENTVTVMP